MIKEIEDFDGLEALRLEGNTVGVEAARVIAKALEKKSQLKVRSAGRAGPDWLGTSSRAHGYNLSCVQTSGAPALLAVSMNSSSPLASPERSALARALLPV